jgi:hypothetical protein
MAARNADSMTTEQGEFKPHKPRAEPMTTKGHQAGHIVSDKDNAPEFTTKTLRPGSAPEDRTFNPNPQSKIPTQADDTGDGQESAYTSASATLGGIDSGDAYAGLGRPVEGQTSTEMHHEGKPHRKAERAGLEGVGSSGDGGMNDPKYNPRDAEDDHPKGPILAREHNATLSS